jgi:hypothetical protein
MFSYRLPDFKYPVYSVNFNPNSKTLYNQFGNIEIEEIDNLIKSNSFIILDFNRDHPNFILGKTNITEAFDYFSNNGLKNIFYLTSENIPNNSSIRFFPCWLYQKSKEYSTIDMNIKADRNYPLSCLNRFPSPHRIYIFYHLLQKKYFPSCLTSFLGLTNPYNNFTEIGEYNEMYFEVPNEIKLYYQKTKFSKKLNEDKYYWTNDHNPNHAAYLDSYLNLITESTYYHSFFTEKTAKALAGEQLFILAGGKSSIENLKSLGFECFSTINYEYDDIDNWLKRMDSILNLLDNIFLNIKDIFWIYSKERQYNREYFLSGNFRRKCLQQVQDLLK